MGDPIDFRRLFKLRLVVARHGEMDVGGWWNAVFEVARIRCHELFDPPGCMTLWSLPAAVEVGAGKKVLVQ